jgi:hypothetical protein
LNLLILILFLEVGCFAQSKFKEIVIKDLVKLENVENKYACVIEIPEKLNDLSDFMGVTAQIANTGNSLFWVEGFMNEQRWINSCVYLKPGETKSIEILFKRMQERGTKDFPAMNGLPGGSLWHWLSEDPAQSKKITFIVYSEDRSTLTISEIRPYGKFIPPKQMASTKDFFPFIDRFGQYKHTDWPGKINDKQDLKQAIQKEQEEFKLIPGPYGRNRFGGWKNGPRLEATGHFRTAKVDGKWWLVDTEGCLFWSQGVTCIGFNGANTRISGRKNFFKNLPEENDPLYQFFSKTRDETYCNFSKANLYRKYGDDWKKQSIINILKRLKSWGINSFGNWSDPEVYLYQENRVPYTVSISPQWPKIDGESAKFPDVFDSSFQKSVAAAMQSNGGNTKDDLWCIGYFVDNELSVSGLTNSLMKQPANGYAKQAFISYLKGKYASIKELNKTWETNYTSWTNIELLTELPGKAGEDKKVFDLQILDRYYKTCLAEVKRVAPNKLYLGSRLHCHYYPDDQTETELIKVASRYCDVISFNRYRFSAKDLILPEGIDKPTIIGEFHFGALDRGHFHTGLRSVANQKQRAEAYYQYVKGALNNPQIVGTHWFQYSDQAFTGRGDGENYQIGFIDICDNPYPEIVEAARKIGYQMYQTRMK